MMSVAVVIPFYNGDEYIQACLDSIYSGPLIRCSTYIVNNSTKPTSVRDVATQFPLVQVLDVTPRSGFGKACSVGAESAIVNGADILLILNQDTILAPNCLDILVDTLTKYTELAIAAPLQFTYDFKGIEEFFIKYYVTQG